jgi:hypothetical protein
MDERRQSAETVRPLQGTGDFVPVPCGLFTRLGRGLDSFSEPYLGLFLSALGYTAVYQ